MATLHDTTQQMRQWGYTIVAFGYFLGFALEMTLIGFVLLTIGGRTPAHKRRYHQILQRQSQFVINHIPQTTFTYINRYGEDFSKPALVISNHQSHIDLMGILMLTPNLIVLTKQWVWHNPFYGAVIRYADFLPIAEGEQLLGKLKQLIAQGYSIMVFPEGTRSADCTIQRFHKGAFYLAEQLKLDIVPVFLHHFGQVLPKTSYHLHPGDMTLEVDKRIAHDDAIMASGYRNVTKQMHQYYLAKYEAMCHHR